MRVLLLTAYFPPDTGSASHLFYELGAELAKTGHTVTVVTSMPSYHVQGSLERYQGRIWLREGIKGMDVVRVATPQLPRRLMFGRALWQFSGALTFVVVGLLVPPQDVALIYSPPLPLGLAAWALRGLRGVPFVFNVQDLFPKSIIDLGLLKNRWIIRAFEAIERFVYRRADAITVHSGGNRQHVIGKGTGATKVSVIPNWVDTNFIRPEDRMNGFREEHALGDHFLVSFAGVLGYSQDLDVVLEAAALARNEANILWLIVGDGVEKDRLEAKAQHMDLPNVRFLPMQPRDKYPSILHASDVCLTTLHAEVTSPVVPSKILSAMAAGRPVVASLDLNGDAPKVIEEAKCGFTLPPEDPDALADAVMTLYRDKALREELGRNGRLYAEKHLSLKSSVSQYEELFQQILEERRGNA